jgi:hypothetical protein
MRIRHNSARLVLVAALAIVAFGAVASSAMAVSIEPLNTKFTGTSTNVKFEQNSSNEVTCKKTTFTGTTSSTKTNAVGVAAAFSECSSRLGTVQDEVVPYAGCKEPMMTLTVGEKGALTPKLNCEITITQYVGSGKTCRVTIPRQTTSGGKQTWADVPVSSLEINFKEAGFKEVYFEPAGNCNLAYWNVEEHSVAMNGSVVLKGIQAH